MGQRIGGHFTVNPDDMTPKRISGGILADVLGRRQYRRTGFVSYNMFMVPHIPDATLLVVQVALMTGNYSSAIAYLPGVEATDTAIQNAHRYTNLLSIPVCQNDSAFLVLINHETEARTKTLLGGSVIFTSADLGISETRRRLLQLLDPTAPELRCMSDTRGKERIGLTSAGLVTFNTGCFQYLKRGSSYLPYLKLYPYYGGIFCALFNEVEAC